MAKELSHKRQEDNDTKDKGEESVGQRAFAAPDEIDEAGTWEQE